MQIKLHPRVHLTLISLHEGGYRANGGLGFSLSEPAMTCYFKAATHPLITDMRMSPLSQEESEELAQLLLHAQQQKKFLKSIDVQVNGGFGTHIGLGSGTGIKLACLEALYTLNGAGVTRDELVQISGRGGTSGIGVSTYFNGGAIFDLGHRNPKEFLPSHAAKISGQALQLNRIPMPEWDFGLCIPKNLQPKTRSEEISFFQKTCPISKEASYETLYHILYGTYAAILENDLETFCDSISNIQHCAWKKAERAEYGDELLEIEHKLHEAGAKAVALTSLGPSLFFVGDQNVIGKAQALLPSCNVLAVRAANTGREILYA